MCVHLHIYGCICLGVCVETLNPSREVLLRLCSGGILRGPALGMFQGMPCGTASLKTSCVRRMLCRHSLCYAARFCFGQCFADLLQRSRRTGVVAIAAFVRAVFCSHCQGTESDRRHSPFKKLQTLLKGTEPKQKYGRQATQC